MRRMIIVTLAALLVLAQPSPVSLQQDADYSRESRAAIGAHHLCSGLWVVGRGYKRTPDEVLARAKETGATPFDVEGVELSHEGPLCSFDAFLAKYELKDPALGDLATIVRGADTARLDLAPQCAGLLAISLGLSQLYEDDHEQLQHGFVVYDALYAWLTKARGETHTWNPQRVPSHHN